LEKRRLDQALNAKEFAVCAGVSYSTARSWFHLPGFPAFRGVIFWQDFVQWRTGQTGRPAEPLPAHTYVNRLRRAGVPREAAMRLVNHSSELIHQVYQREKVEDVAQWRDAVQFPS
jgi:hypothetical protein